MRAQAAELQDNAARQAARPAVAAASPPPSQPNGDEDIAATAGQQSRDGRLEYSKDGAVHEPPTMRGVA